MRTAEYILGICGFAAMVLMWTQDITHIDELSALAAILLVTSAMISPPAVLPSRIKKKNKK